MTLTVEQIAELRKPFPEDVIGKLPKSSCQACSKSQRRKCEAHEWVYNCPLCKSNHSSATVHLDFVGHAPVTDRLLIVDPLWTWEPLALDEDGLPRLDKERNLWIRLTVGGHTRLGVGDGDTMKIRIGDAIRNAAMRFGVALDLWSRNDLEQTHGARMVFTPTGPDDEGRIIGLGAALAAKGEPTEAES